MPLLPGAPIEIGQPLLEAELSYNEGHIQRRSTLTSELSSEPPINLVKAEALSAQFSAMKAATTAYYERNYEETFEIFSPFEAKFSQNKIEGLEAEYELVTALNETFAIEAGQIESLENPPKFARLRGDWRVTRADNMVDVHRGDRFNFSKNSVEHFQKSKGFDTPYEIERYKVNDSQIYLTYSDLTFNYHFSKKGKLRLVHRDFDTRIYLEPYIALQAAGGELLD